MKEPLSKNPTLEYDNEKAYLILKAIFNNANRTFLKTDRSLIDDDVAERTLCGALKSHLEKELSFAKIKGYYVDVEYNRNYGQVKTILDDNFEVVSIQCDLIVHSRGNNIKQDNLLAIEMKKSYRDQFSKDLDRMRLRALTKSTYDNDIWVALWGMCLISILIGLDLYTAALIAFAAFMLSLTGFMKPEYALKRRSDHFEIHLELTSKNSLRDFIAAVRKLGLKIDNIELNTAYMNSGLYVYSIALTIVSGEFKKAVRHDDIIAAISSLEYVNFCEELD